MVSSETLSGVLLSSLKLFTTLSETSLASFMSAIFTFVLYSIVLFVLLMDMTLVTFSFFLPSAIILTLVLPIESGTFTDQFLLPDGFILAGLLVWSV